MLVSSIPFPDIEEVEMKRRWGTIGTAVLAAVALVLSMVGLVTEPAGVGMEQQSAGGYAVRLEDGTGSEIFSVTDAGNTDVAGTLGSDGAATLASLTVPGASALQGPASLSGMLTVPRGTEHLGALSYVTKSITYTAGAGTSGTLATIEDGEIWLVYDVYIQTTTTFTDTAGDDEAFVIGDGNDDDGFIVASSTELASDFTEATGFAAGFYGIENGSGGAYTPDDGGPFIYAPSGADETIDYALSSGAGDDIGAGALTMYLVYMRVQ